MTEISELMPIIKTINETLNSNPTRVQIIELISTFQQQHAAVFSTESDPIWLRMLGIKSSATGGEFALLRNWEIAAQKRIDKIYSDIT